MRNIKPIYLYAFGAAALYWLFSKTSTGESVNRTVLETIMRGPRGIRNNNPGNIRKSFSPWKGLAQDQSGDSAFAIFIAPEWGIRAMTRIIRQYQERGLRTVAHIVSTWAPSTENDTAAYIKAVSDDTGLSPYDVVTDDDLPEFLAAIINHENGEQPYSMEVIQHGIALERT